MKILKLIISLLLIFAVAWRLFQHPPQTDANANAFSSRYYSDYHAQLISFLQAHPNYKIVRNNAHIKPLIDVIEQPLGTPQEQRSVHENFVRQLRKLITNHDDQNQFLQDLIQWIFLKADMKKTAQLYFYNLLQEPHADLSSTLQNLKASEEFSGSIHEANQEDQFLHGNLPFLLFTLPNKAETKVLRMGLPLDDFPKYSWPWISPRFHPEFLEFLKHQSSHLYVNLMKRKGVEAASTYALEELERTTPHLSLVTLDKNSDFYWQADKNYPAEWESEQFKEFYYQKLTDGNGDFYWSVHLNREDWKKELKLILDGIHQKAFSNQPTLDQQERLNFIELSYLAILDQLVEMLQPASLNITCRQCMDRGPSLYVLWMFQKKLITDKELIAYLLTPPLLIHNRPAHLSRINRMIALYKTTMDENRQ